jgi:hypothetical protein
VRHWVVCVPATGSVKQDTLANNPLMNVLLLFAAAVAVCCCQAFAEVLAGNEAWTAPMEETYALLGVDPASITTLDDYLQVCRTVLLCWMHLWPCHSGRICGCSHQSIVVLINVSVTLCCWEWTLLASPHWTTTCR